MDRDKLALQLWQEKLLSYASDEEYWIELNPGLSICDCKDPNLQSRNVDDTESGIIFQSLLKDGYASIQNVIDCNVVDRLKKCVDVLRTAGWPPVFAFVYDNFWQLFHVPILDHFLSKVLGIGFLQTSHIWLFNVEDKTKSGWPPHIDGRRPGKRITVWIAITEAGPENGCIYVIPKSRMTESFDKAFTDCQDVKWGDFLEILHAAKALPVPAGSILCWEYGIVHWGSYFQSGSEPRVSVGASFVGKDTSLSENEPPTITSNPSFKERLYLIGKAMKTYENREPVLQNYRFLAEKLIEKFQ